MITHVYAASWYSKETAQTAELSYLLAYTAAGRAALPGDTALHMLLHNASTNLFSTLQASRSHASCLLDYQRQDTQDPKVITTALQKPGNSCTADS